MIQTQLLSAAPADLSRAAALLQDGEVVGMPTETVYGLAADAMNPTAVERIFAAKGRPADNPLIVHIADIAALETVAAEIPEAARRLAEAFWPGPLTMIFPRRPEIPLVTTGGLETVGVRMPEHPVARELIRLAGMPLAAPSANRSGYPSPTTAAHVMADMNGRIPAVVDGGACRCGLESTVICFDGENAVRILRPGFVTKEMLAQVVADVTIDGGIFREAAVGEKVQSPGMKYRHYAPNAHVTLVEGSIERFRQLVAMQQSEGVYALIFDADAPEFPFPHRTYGANVEEQGSQLFARLRELDDAGATAVYVRMPEKDGVGLAVYNRLLRAAGFDVIHLAELM